MPNGYLDVPSFPRLRAAGSLRLLASLLLLSTSSAMTSDLLGAVPRVYVERLEPSTSGEHLDCPSPLRFGIFVDHEDMPGLCGGVLGVVFSDGVGAPVRASGVWISMAAIWGGGLDFDDLDGAGVSIFLRCFEPDDLQPASAATPIAQFELELPNGFDGTLQVHFVDPVIFRGRREPQIAGLVFNGLWVDVVEFSDSVPYEIHCPRFLRGDPNDDGAVDISDAVQILEFLFSSGEPIRCLLAADANSDARVDVSDAVYLLEYLFLGIRDTLPQPFPEIGDAPQVFGLTCEGLHPLGH